MPVTSRPPELRLSINQGSSFHRELPTAYDRTAVDVNGNPTPFDFTDWTARLDVVDEHENPVVSFATSGENGVITLSNDGQTDLDLDASFTDALVATVEVAGVIHAPCYGNLVYTSPTAVPYTKARAVVEIVRSPS